MLPDWAGHCRTLCTNQKGSIWEHQQRVGKQVLLEFIIVTDSTEQIKDIIINQAFPRLCLQVTTVRHHCSSVRPAFDAASHSVLPTAYLHQHPGGPQLTQALLTAWGSCDTDLQTSHLQHCRKGGVALPSSQHLNSGKHSKL